MLKINRKNKRFTKIEINLSSLSSNIRVLKSHLASPRTRIMAVVKSNAYGHGIVEVSKHAVKNGVNWLGVALAEDAIMLRKVGIKVPILILGEPPMEIVNDAIKYDFTICINSYEKAKAISRKCSKYGKKARVHIKVDTGMNRIGLGYGEAVEEISKIVELPSLDIEGIFTHFSCAGEKDESYTMAQWEKFQSVLASLAQKNIRFTIVHCANSAAFLRYKQFHCDMVRLGISVYGLSPFSQGSEQWLGQQATGILGQLRPILSLKSKVSFVKNVPSGQSISYGAAFTTSRPSRIATVPIGYADGYTRLYSNKAGVLVNGAIAPIAGNVTMDQIMIDVTDVPDNINIKEGTEVILIGGTNKKISADHLSSIIGTINYEVLCMLKDKIPRIFIN